jgi:hypothetical protein
MSMIVAENHFETAPRSNGYRFAFTFVMSALLTLVGVPAVALAISYVAGGAATSMILFVYLFAILTNGPFLLAALAVMAGAVALPRLMSGVAQHQHA